MRTLSLLRHAKSSWSTPGIPDEQRPLNDRGRQAVPIVAGFMRENDIVPDLILCSSAVRTRETIENLWPEGTARPKVRFDSKLYLAMPQDMLALIRRTPRTVRHLMVVGHNPGLQTLALELIGHGDPALVRAIAEKLPTAALVVLRFPGSGWAEVAPGDGTLVHYATPKRIAARAPS